MSLEERAKALEELLKLREQKPPGFKRKEKLIKELIKQGLTEQRAEELADWAIEWLDKNRRLTRDEELAGLRETAAELMEQGKTTREIVEELAGLGVTEEFALELVADVAGGGESEKESESVLLPEEGLELARKHARYMWHGVFWMLGGIVIAAAMLRAASSGIKSMLFLAAFGTIFYGIANLVSGHSGLLKVKRGNIDQETEDEEKEYMCPVCGLDIRIGQRRCPRCRTEMDWSES